MKRIRSHNRPNAIPSFCGPSLFLYFFQFLPLENRIVLFSPSFSVHLFYSIPSNILSDTKDLFIDVIHLHLFPSVELALQFVSRWRQFLAPFSTFFSLPLPSEYICLWFSQVLQSCQLRSQKFLRNVIFWLKTRYLNCESHTIEHRLLRLITDRWCLKNRYSG